MQVIIEQEHPDAERIEPDYFPAFVEKVMWADHSHIAAHEYKAPKHLHHFHQLDVILEGEYKLIRNENRAEVGQRGDAWIIPPLCWHSVQCSKPHYLCSFKFHLTPFYWSHFGITFRRFRLSEQMCDYLNFCSAKWKENKPWTEQQISSVLSLCLMEFLEQNPQKSTEEDSSLDEFRHALWPLLRAFLNDPGAHWTVAQMAQQLGLSPNYFSHCFHNVIGQPPQRYILEATMRTAAGNLLSNPNAPIKRVAEDAGYANVHTFSRAFTQVFQISPAAYRRDARREV